MNYKDGSTDSMPPQLVEQQAAKRSSSCIVDRIHNSTHVQENENGATDCRLRVSSSFKIYDEVKRCWPMKQLAYVQKLTRMSKESVVSIPS